MSDWQPIKTAPKDGTVVRVKNSAMDHPVKAKWAPYKSRRLPWLAVRDEWILVEDEGEKFMPLPPGELIIPDQWQPL